MEYPDKYKFTKDENRRFARSNLVKLVHTESRFEGVNTTLPQTQTIMDGMSVQGVPVADILTIVNLKKAWQFITESNASLSLDFEKQINLIVAKEDALIPGSLRSGQGGVSLSDNEFFEPPIVNEQEEIKFIEELQDNDCSITDRAITLMYHNMRNQIFWDGNKRTATIVANKLMIDHGAGLINVPLDKWELWNQLLSNFYRTNEMSQLKTWTYDNAIQGLSVRMAR
ncbi:Fic family protein [Xylocopilactobacillus apicola]|uniref:Fido domain-containing protein n=1 Tax=Xylocopilactobacillus apicola TaxID=2932184 RepID=A0AAU9CUA2_9LACO|nr:Fic family protein [Xylocopilactobacillus apicola]BDR57584.1 hypothetical protein XA3_00250 [Xylocopilactobacillus apicola]